MDNHDEAFHQPRTPRSDRPVWRGLPDDEDEPTGEIPIQRVSPYRAQDEEGIVSPVRVKPPKKPAGTDPTFPFLIALALSVGLIPLASENVDLRYTLSWLVLALFAVGVWLFGETERIRTEQVENVAWGAVFGVIVGLPLLFAGSSTLQTTVRLIFRAATEEPLRALTPGAVLAYAVFVMPLAETLFFRGVMQYGRPFWLVGLWSSLWSILLFFPMIEVARFPVIAVVIGTALVLTNMMYSYVRHRNGLAAAWVCQIVVNVIVLFLPYIGS